MKIKHLLLCVFIFPPSFFAAQSSASQNTSDIRLNPWFSQLDMSFLSGTTYAVIKEFEYTKNSSGEYKLLSRLNWNRIVTWTVGTKLSCGINRWRIMLDMSTALPVFHTAYMEDRDWKTLGTVLTDFSKHPVRINSFFDTKAVLGYRFLERTPVSLGAAAAFEYTATELTAYDGAKLMPSQTTFSGNVASYVQRLYLPYLMLWMEWKPHRLFETELFLYVSPVSFIRALDTHYKTNSANVSLAPQIDRQYSDRMQRPASLKTELVLRLNTFKKNTSTQTTEVRHRSIQHAFELHTGLTFVPELKGKNYLRKNSTSMPFAQTENKAGSSYFSFCISLAYCMRIR